MTQDQWTTIIILGIYTMVNGFVWVFQKNQINKLNTLLGSIETYHKIFDMDKINSYVKLMEKKSMIEAKNKSQRVLKELKEELSNEQTIYMDEQYKEYVLFAIRFLSVVKEENKIDFAKKNFPKTWESLLDSLTSSNNTE